MQRWQEQLTKHPLNTVLNRLEELASRELDDIDDLAFIERARFLKVVKLAKQVVKSIDPEIAPMDLLDQFHNQIKAHGVTNTIEQFASNSDPRLFNALNEQINPALSYLYQLSSLKFARSTRKADIDAATSSFESFAKKTKESFHAFKAEAEASLTEAKQSADRVTSISAKADAIEAEINKSIDEWNSSSSSILTSQKSDFASDKQLRDEKFAKEMDEFREKFRTESETLIESNNVALIEKQSLFDKNIEAINIDAKKRHEDIIKLHNLVAHDSVTGGYKSIADREYDAAKLWRKGAIACIIATILWLLASLFWFTPVLYPEKLFWMQVAKSVSLTALLLSFAVYASKQSTLHRINERKSRTFFLQVQAFDPFIANLPEEAKRTLKEELSKRIFGADDHSQDSNLMEKAEFKGIERGIDLLGQLHKIVGKG
nr:hypothetical protein [Brucella intermedia]